MRRAQRRKALLEDIEQFQGLAFPISEPGDEFEIERLAMARDSVVRARVLLDCSLIEEMSALILMHYWLSTDRQFAKLKYFGQVEKYSSLYEASDVLRHDTR